MKKWVVFLFVGVLLVGLAVVAAVPPEKTLTVRGVNAAIKAQGAGWVAVENKFSRTPAGAFKAFLGALPPELSGGTDRPVERGKPGPTLPDAFDWRSEGGFNWMTPVRDQKTCAAGLVFATLAALEAKIRINSANPGLDLDLSEQFLIACEMWNYGCAGGSWPSRLYGFMETSGAPDEACLPYTGTNGTCSQRCDNWQARARRIEGWKRVCNNKANNDSIKLALYTNGPVTCYMDVYEDFKVYGAGCYQHVTGAFLGGHVVCIAGWTADGCWIVKNSWGESWGEQGYFRIKFGDCRIGTDAVKLLYAGN